MSFGDVIRSAYTPNNSPTGVGGDASVIWHCDYYADKVYELSSVDLSVIRSSSAVFDRANGIGGDANAIWYCYNVGGNDRIYELDTADFSVIRYAASPSDGAIGAGGDDSTIWHCDYNEGKVYELAITDFSVTKSAVAPENYATGIGGDVNRIWFSENNAYRVYELDVVDFSIIRYASLSGYNSVGGDASTLWRCDYNTGMIYELDSAVNVPPVANAGGPYVGEVDKAVSFDGSGSTDADGTIVLYEWDFGDSETGVGVNANHIYTVANTYTVVLTVTDDGGLTDNDTTSATISEAVAVDDSIPDAFAFGRIKKRRHRVEV